MDHFRRTNLDTWEERAPAHAASPDYHVDELASDDAFLSEVVRFDLPRLGDLAGLDVVHLQCHIGTDTVSLAKLGGRVTGLDFSPAALAQARRLAERAGVEVRFVESELYAAPRRSAPRTTWSTRASAPSTGCQTSGHGPRWSPRCCGPAGGCTCARGTRCCGRWPILGPTACSSSSTRTSRRTSRPCSTSRAPTSGQTTSSPTTAPTRWNHGLGEIVTALLAAGLRLTRLEEHDSVPWDALPGMMEALPGGEFRLRDRPERLPHSYTLQAAKDG